LRKKEDLSVGERALLKQHTTIGAQTLADAELSLLPIAKDIAHCHHEHWNGTGFPMGLSGEAIPLPARIVAVADVFDSLCYSRVTPHQASIEEALDFIHRGAGTHFDPRLCTLLSPLIQKLQREHDNLAVFLGADAHRSPFVNARRHIATTLWQDASASGEASQAAYR
jgi:putative two-component system response regulator